MQHKHIQATSLWRKGCAHYDTILVSSDSKIAGIHEFEVAHVFFFFSFQHQDKEYSCALIQWYSHVGSEPDKDTGFGWLNWTWTTMVIPTSLLFIFIPFIELFISCQHIKTTHLLSTPLQCIHHLIHISSFISTDLWTMYHLRFFPKFHCFFA